MANACSTGSGSGGSRTMIESCRLPVLPKVSVALTSIGCSPNPSARSAAHCVQSPATSRTGTGAPSTVNWTDATFEASLAVPVTVSVNGGAGTVWSCGNGSNLISGNVVSATTTTSSFAPNGTMTGSEPGSG